MKAIVRLSVLALAALAPLLAEDPLRDRLPVAATDSDYYDAGRPAEAKVELGRLLFFDKILSGNKNIACATCHHPKHGTSDGLALPLGEGPRGLGPQRRPGTRKSEAVHERIPRNSPALFNLGAAEFTRMFHDGRVETDPENYYEGGFVTPAKWKLPTGLDNVLAAQAMFPVSSPGEMTGQKGENPVADAVSLNNAAGPGGVWEQLGRRLQAVPEYVDRFKQAFPEEVREPSDVSYVLASNAIAAFEAAAFRADNSPFDRYLRGDRTALSIEAERGLELFYGRAGCDSCHSGTFQTDHDFHAVAIPQIGPGKADGNNADYWRATGMQVFTEDFGRGRVTVRAEDNYRFRTPSLRNVSLTGPWGHDGAYRSLEAVVRHHLDPVRSLNRYVPEEGLLIPLDRALEITATGSRIDQSWLNPNRLQGLIVRDTWVQSHPELRQAIAEANELQPISLTSAEITDLLAFLESLTDPASTDLSELIPRRVPSGLPIDD